MRLTQEGPWETGRAEDWTRILQELNPFFLKCEYGRSSGEGNGNPLQDSYQVNRQRSLAGYSTWGCKSQTQLRD